MPVCAFCCGPAAQCSVLCDKGCASWSELQDLKAPLVRVELPCLPELIAACGSSVVVSVSCNWLCTSGAPVGSTERSAAGSCFSRSPWTPLISSSSTGSPNSVPGAIFRTAPTASRGDSSWNLCAGMLSSKRARVLPLRRHDSAVSARRCKPIERSKAAASLGWSHAHSSFDGGALAQRHDSILSLPAGCPVALCPLCSSQCAATYSTKCRLLGAHGRGPCVVRHETYRSGPRTG